MSGLARRLASINRRHLLMAAILAQLLLLAWVTAPRLSPRLFGHEYRLAVRAVDPVDPFRGRYVDLTYAYDIGSSGESPREGPVWVPLVRHGELWRPASVARARPKSQPALSCEARNDVISCGIESFFASEADARRLGQALRRRGAIARVRIDAAGRAAIMGLQPR